MSTTVSNKWAEGHRLMLLLGMLVAFGPLAIDLYLPALPAISTGLSAAPEKVQLSVTVFLAGFALGMLCYGPLSDRYGRRHVMLAGIALFVVASLACAWAPSVQALIIARGFQALGGGAAAVLARAVVRDLYPGPQALRKLSVLQMVMTVAPLLAPVLGTLLLQVAGWRSTFLALLLWGVLNGWTVWYLLPETLPPERRGHLSLGRAFGIYGHMLLSGRVWSLLLVAGMSFAGLFAYITASPDYFIAQMGLTPAAYSLVFLCNALGIFAMNFVNTRFVHRWGPVAMLRLGTSLAFVGAMLVAMGMRGVGNLPVVMLGLFLLVSVTGLLGANCAGLLMQLYPQNAGAAAALHGAGQFGFGMLASAVLSMWYDGSGIPLANVVLLTAVLSCIGYWLYVRWQPKN